MKPVAHWIVIAVTCLVAPFARGANSEDEALASLIRGNDARFWKAYNTCDLEHFSEFFTQDVEFYHDKGGPMRGLANLTARTKENLCGASGWRLRREAVPGTDTVFPLRDGKTIYGAIFSGEHLFYVREPGKNEYLDGRANFVHLWLKTDGEFRMARILSFNHRPANEGQGK